MILAVIRRSERRDHLRDLAPWQHSSEKALQRWKPGVDLTIQGFELTILAPSTAISTTTRSGRSMLK